MTKFDLLPASEQEELKRNIFFYHPESYALYDNGEFCPDVSLFMSHIIWVILYDAMSQSLWVIASVKPWILTFKAIEKQLGNQKMI